MSRTILSLLLMTAMLHTTHAEPPTNEGWKLVFEDNFDGGDKALDENWTFQNGPSGHILSSRWRENAKLEDGLLKLVGRKETRAGQDWTAASCWSKREFQYGYFECRYRYAAATGTNNSFWIMTRGKPKQRFEIDINEGHYPNEVNMNLHNWSGKHWAKGGRWYLGPPEPTPAQSDAGFQFLLDKSITTTRLRFLSPDGGPVRVMELRAFPPSKEGYPAVFPSKLEAQPDVPNVASQAKVEASSVMEPQYAAEKAVDGKLSTASRWLSDKSDGPHHLTLTFSEPKEIACLQLVSGWQDDKGWHGIVRDFHFEYWTGRSGGRSPEPARLQLATSTKWTRSSTSARTSTPTPWSGTRTN